MLDFFLKLFEKNYITIDILVFLNSIQSMFTNPIFIVLFIIIFLFFYSLNLNRIFFYDNKDLNYKIKKFKVENFSILNFFSIHKKTILKNFFYAFGYTFFLFSVLFVLVMNKKIDLKNYQELKNFIQSDFSKEEMIDIDNPLLFIFLNQKYMFYDKVTNPKDKKILKKIIMEEVKDGVITYQDLFCVIELTHLFAKKSK